MRKDEVNNDFASVKKEIMSLIARLRPETIKVIAEHPEYLSRILTNDYVDQAASNDSYPIDYTTGQSAALDSEDVIYALEIARTEYDYSYLEKFGIDFLMRIAVSAWDKFRYLRNYGD